MGSLWYHHAEESWFCNFCLIIHAFYPCAKIGALIEPNGLTEKLGSIWMTKSEMRLKYLAYLGKNLFKLVRNSKYYGCAELPYAMTPKGFISSNHLPLSNSSRCQWCYVHTRLECCVMWIFHLMRTTQSKMTSTKATLITLSSKAKIPMVGLGTWKVSTVDNYWFYLYFMWITCLKVYKHTLILYSWNARLTCVNSYHLLIAECIMYSSR